LNQKEVSDWVWNVVSKGGTCVGVKSWVLDDFINIAFFDKDTGDRINIIYGDTISTGTSDWKVYLQDKLVFIDGGGFKFQSFQQGTPIFDLLTSLIKDE